MSYCSLRRYGTRSLNCGMNARGLKKQSGLNLIELMIAITIGLFISLMVVQYLSTSSKLFRQQGADSNLEANGTFAISYLSHYVRQAGTHNVTGSDVPFYTGDCDVNPCTFDSDNASDQMAVQLFPHNNRDCVGEAVTSGNRVANVFYVQNNSLMCRGYDVTDGNWLAPNGEELIDGVEQLQVLYGVANLDRQVVKYVDAARVAPIGLSMNQADLAWDQVRSVKISILVSDDANTGTVESRDRPYQLLDAAQINFHDRVPRKVYSTTVMLNSKLP